MKWMKDRIIQTVKAGTPLTLQEILKGFDENKEDIDALDNLIKSLFIHRIRYDKISDVDWVAIENKYNSLTGKKFVPSQENIEKMLNTTENIFNQNPRQYSMGAKLVVDLVLYYDPENERAIRLQNRIELRSK